MNSTSFSRLPGGTRRSVSNSVPTQVMVAALWLAGCCTPFGGSSPPPPPPLSGLPGALPSGALGVPGGPVAKPGVPGAVGQVPGAALPGAVPAVPAVPTLPPLPVGADSRAGARMNEYTLQKIAAGYVPHGAPGADSLSRGASQRYSATLSAGDCYTLAAFGGAGVRDLDIYLTSPAGREIARDIATDSRPIVNTCVQETGTYAVRVLMYNGRGPYTYQIYRNPGAAAQVVGVAGLDPSVRRRMDQFSGRYVARGFRPVPGLSGSGVLGVGQSQDFTVNLTTPGSCYAFVGFAGSGMSDLDIYLSDPSGAQLQRDIAVDPVADVKQFIVVPGGYRMRLNAYRGSGAFAYQVYERPQRTCE